MLALPVIHPLFAIILLNLIHISLHICVLKLLLNLSPEFFSFILLKRSTGNHVSTKRTAILSAPRSHADRCPMAGTDILCSGESGQRWTKHHMKVVHFHDHWQLSVAFSEYAQYEQSPTWILNENIKFLFFSPSSPCNFYLNKICFPFCFN